jgi:uncharacterized protein
LARYSAPGLYLEPAASGRTIAAVRTDVAAFIGVAARGPLDTPTRVSSFAEFAARFGGLSPPAYLGYAVKAYFENGGRDCWIVRVAAPPVETGRAAGAFQPAGGVATIVADPRGFAPGAIVTLRRGPRAHDALIRAVEGQDRLVWDRPLPAELLDPAAPGTLTLEAGAAAAYATVPDAAGRPALRVEAASAGAWGSALTVRLRSAPGARSKVGSPADGAGATARLDSVSGIPAGSVVSVRRADDPPADGERRIVAAVEPRSATLTWDEPLPAIPGAGDLVVETIELSLDVFVAGDLAEVLRLGPLVRAPEPGATWAVAPAPTALVRVVDARPPVAASLRLGDDAAVAPGIYSLVGGRDGTAALALEDFTGRAGAAERRGLRALELVDEPALVAIPDLMIEAAPEATFAPPPPAPPPDPCLLDAVPPAAERPPPRLELRERVRELGDSARRRGQVVLVEECERLHDRVAILDPPPSAGAGAIARLRRLLDWRDAFASSFAALYAPWVGVLDPMARRPALTRAVPPSGHVAGCIARVDRDSGVHAAPANVELRWAQELAFALDQERHGLLNDAGINCFRAIPGRGIRILGARTAAADSAWRYLSVRRLLLAIEEALEQSLQWAVFEPVDDGLRRTVEVAAGTFLRSLFDGGALAGTEPAEAYRVRCLGDAEAGEGKLVAEVAVAPVTPMEFVVFRIGRSEDRLEVVEA